MKVGTGDGNGGDVIIGDLGIDFLSGSHGDDDVSAGDNSSASSRGDSGGDGVRAEAMIADIGGSGDHNLSSNFIDATRLTESLVDDD